MSVTAGWSCHRPSLTSGSVLGPSSSHHSPTGLVERSSSSSPSSSWMPLEWQWPFHPTTTSSAPSSSLLGHFLRYVIVPDMIYNYTNLSSFRSFMAIRSILANRSICRNILSISLHYCAIENLSKSNIYASQTCMFYFVIQMYSLLYPVYTGVMSLIFFFFF